MLFLNFNKKNGLSLDQDIVSKLKWIHNILKLKLLSFKKLKEMLIAKYNISMEEGETLVKLYLENKNDLLSSEFNFSEQFSKNAKNLKELIESQSVDNFDRPPEYPDFKIIVYWNGMEHEDYLSKISSQAKKLGKFIIDNRKEISEIRPNNRRDKTLISLIEVDGVNLLEVDTEFDPTTYYIRKEDIEELLKKAKV